MEFLTVNRLGSSMELIETMVSSGEMDLTRDEQVLLSACVDQLGYQAFVSGEDPELFFWAREPSIDLMSLLAQLIAEQMELENGPLNAVDVGAIVECTAGLLLEDG